MPSSYPEPSCYSDFARSRVNMALPVCQVSDCTQTLCSPHLTTQCPPWTLSHFPSCASSHFPMALRVRGADISCHIVWTREVKLWSIYWDAQRTHWSAHGETWSSPTEHSATVCHGLVTWDTADNNKELTDNSLVLFLLFKLAQAFSSFKNRAFWEAKFKETLCLWNLLAYWTLSEEIVAASN